MREQMPDKDLPVARCGTPESPVRWKRLPGVLLALYWPVLFAATHLPLPRLNELPTGSDKWMHLVAYAGLGGLLSVWLSTRGASLLRLWAIVPPVCLGYAMIDELLQLLVVSRSADWRDGLADLAGALLGVAGVTLMRVARASRSRLPGPTGPDD
jgi:VanZ family protein